MKLKVAVLDHDTEFMNRLAKVFQQKYADKISLSIFTGKDTLYQSPTAAPVDIVLMDSSISIVKENIPSGITAGYQYRR